MSHTSIATPPSRSRRWKEASLARDADQLHARLRFLVNSEKVATIGGEPEQAFEQSFASLAYNYIRDQAPKLIDHLVGFQLVDRNNDNTKAVGVFGFKLGNAWAYAPVFFLNGDLKGHELLYLKDQDMFVPLTESWVNYVLAKRPHVLGSPVLNQGRQIGVRQPDIRTLSTPPMMGKRSSAGPQVYPSVPLGGWLPPADGFKGVYGALTLSDLEDAAFATLGKLAEVRTGRVLHDFVRQSPRWCKLAMDACDAYPALGRYVEQFHGRQFFADAVADLQQRFGKSATLQDDMDRTVFEYHFQGGRKARRRKPSVLNKVAAGPAVEMKLKQDAVTSDTGRDLSEEETAAVARNGYLVKDQRTGEEVSVAYDVQVKLDLTNPDMSGLYEVLEKPATFVKALVIMHPHSTRGRRNFATAVRLEPKNWVNAHPTTLFVKPFVGTREEFQKWYDGLSGSDSLETNGVYVLVSESGEGTVPFRVEERLSDGRYRIDVRDYTDSDRASYLPSVDVNLRRDYCSEESSGPDLLFLSDREGTSFKSSNRILQAPQECKALRLSKPQEPSDDSDCCYTPFRSKEDPFHPGNIIDLQTEILQKTAGLKVYADASEASINGGVRMSKLAALRSLILEHGFRTKQAEAMIKQAEAAHVRGESLRLRVIYGPSYPRTKAAFDPFLAGQGPAAPAIQDPAIGYSNEWGNVQTQYPDQYVEEVPELSSYNTDPAVYDVSPENMPDPYAMQQAQQAGQTGQKEVFDTAMVSGLLRSVRQDSMISRYVPDLLKAMDRTGRLLALYYWHNDQFADKFGKSDLPELEDSLRNSFDGIGELVLFLKARDVAPLAGGVEADIDVDDSTGE